MGNCYSQVTISCFLCSLRTEQGAIILIYFVRMDWEKKNQTKTQTHSYNNNPFQCFLVN